MGNMQLGSSNYGSRDGFYDGNSFMNIKVPPKGESIAPFSAPGFSLEGIVLEAGLLIGPAHIEDEVINCKGTGYDKNGKPEPYMKGPFRNVPFGEGASAILQEPKKNTIPEPYMKGPFRNVPVGEGASAIIKGLPTNKGFYPKPKKN
mgnify:CR=1 FL=1